MQARICSERFALMEPVRAGRWGRERPATEGERPS